MYHGPMTGRESGTMQSTTVATFVLSYRAIASINVQVTARWNIVMLKAIQIYVASSPLSMLTTMST